MSFDREIREQISRYCAGEIDAANLETWLAASTWEMDNEPTAIRQLAFDALRLTSEAANGDWTDGELRQQLSDLCGNSIVETPSLVSEDFLGKLSAAEKNKGNRPKGDEARLAAMMRYVRFGSPTEGLSETVQPSDRGFLDQPRDESKTPSPVPKELAAS
jgi:hypothetical protein